MQLKEIKEKFYIDKKIVKTYTDDHKRTIIYKIFNHYESIHLGCAYEGISLTSYYTWKNKLFKDGNLIKKREYVQNKD